MGECAELIKHRPPGITRMVVGGAGTVAGIGATVFDAREVFRDLFQLKLVEVLDDLLQTAGSAALTAVFALIFYSGYKENHTKHRN